MNSVDSDRIESEGSSNPKTTARVVRRSLLCVAATLVVLCVLGHFGVLGDTGTRWAAVVSAGAKGGFTGLGNYVRRRPYKVAFWAVALVGWLVYRSVRNDEESCGDEEAGGE
mgnify:CR=1 FL=1|jgi:hypothetical protein